MTFYASTMLNIATIPNLSEENTKVTQTCFLRKTTVSIFLIRIHPTEGRRVSRSGML